MGCLVMNLVMMYRIEFGTSRVVMLVWGIFLKTDFLPFFDQVGQRIPPPQGYNFEAHCNELRSGGGGERHRKKGIDNREWVPTAWVIDARTILVLIDM